MLLDSNYLLNKMTSVLVADAELFGIDSTYYQGDLHSYKILFTNEQWSEFIEEYLRPAMREKGIIK